MGLSAVAEGVETSGQAAALTMLGCPVGQGFYFSRPLSAPEFSELLSDHFAVTPDITSISPVQANLKTTA